MSKKLGPVLTLLLSVSSYSFAGETQDFCNLVQSQARVESSLLYWPKAFGSVGQHQWSASPIIYGGVSQSISGIFRGFSVDKAASFQCRFHEAEKTVLDAVDYFDDQLFNRQAEIQIPLLHDVLIKADDNIKMESDLFKSQDATIADLDAAFEIKQSIQKNLSELESKYATTKNVPKINDYAGLRAAVEDATKFRARAEALTSLAKTMSSWDVGLAAGGLFNTGTNASSTFATVDITISFGAVPSAINTASIDRQVRKLELDQYNSPTNRYVRLLDFAKVNLDTEKKNADALTSQVDSLQDMFNGLKGIDSLRANRARRMLSIKLAVQKAALAATAAKIEALQAFFAQTNDETR